MDLKTFFRKIIKVFSAAVVAFAVMTSFCLLYYNIPVHNANTSGTTDYKWAPNTFYSRGTEGIAAGRTNNEGFINAFDYENGMDIAALIVGSSHMEGYNVGPYETTASRLDTLLQDKRVYNLGISGHTFLTCCKNLKAALENYRPSEYVIIETPRLDFSAQEIRAVLDGTLPEIADNSGGILALLSRNQFLRLIYHQLSGFMGRTDAESADVVVSAPPQTADDRAALDDLLAYIADIASANKVRIIILYHPTTQIDPDGNLLLPDDAESRANFSESCGGNGIIFLDMTERFQYEYDTNHILPHGFCNSSIGSGHLNKQGHEMIAEELYKIMEEQG